MLNSLNSLQMKVTLVVVLTTITNLTVKAQLHPLSKSDSGIVLQNLQKHEYLIENKDWRAASDALNQAAFVYWNNNHYAAAAELYEKSLGLNQKVSNENGIAMIHNNLGMLYADLGDYDKSLDSFKKTLASRRANKEMIGIISALINMSVVLNNLERFDESVKHLLEALDISRELYDETQMRSVYGMLSETYEKMGNVEKSLQYFELYKSFHESLNRKKIKAVNTELQKERLQNERIASESAKQELEMLRKQLVLYQELEAQDSINRSLGGRLTKRELEVKLLQQENELNEIRANAEAEAKEQLQIQRKYLWLVFGLVVTFLVILLTVMFRYNGKIRKYLNILKLRNSEIEDQRAELLAANKTKDRIFSVISHDLRSPISSLRGFFVYMDEFEVSEEVKIALGSVESQLTNSASLLDNLLVWSRSQLDNSEPSFDQISVQSLVDQSFRLLAPVADKKKIQLRQSIPNDLQINSDERFVDIVIRNIVQNAIKFTKEGGSVDVTAKTGDSHTTITISDTGVGMDEEKMVSLFDISTNRSTNGTSNEQGSGLGLILCKELIERVNGVINVSSTPQKGTSFDLIFTY